MKKISITKTGIQKDGEISAYNTVGETRYGYIDKKPKVGQIFVVWDYDKKSMYNAWSTSEVTEIVDSNNFNTIYSKYTWKYEND